MPPCSNSIEDIDNRHCLLTIAAAKGCQLHQMDVSTAFHGQPPHLKASGTTPICCSYELSLPLIMHPDPQLPHWCWEKSKRWE